MPVAHPRLLEGWRCRCLHCHEALAADEPGLRCAGCGRHYPVRGGVPLLVKEPAAYLRAERAALAQAIFDARRRGSLLDHAATEAASSSVSLARRRDVAKAEAAQAETLLALLDEPAVGPVADGGDALGAVRPGWSFDTLVPYLLRDWGGTTELRRTAALIGATLRDAFPDPWGKSVAFAGCGAGGLLAHVPAEFARVLGFDLTLPILAAARRLLDGQAIDLPLPRAMSEKGGIRLHTPSSASSRRVAVVAMDALDTALPDRSVDCVVTVFLTDILPDPRALADEIRRVLIDDGVWINYGPSGNNLRASWRFDAAETSRFLQAAGFAVMQADAARVTNLDISEICPSISHRSAVCYLTLSRKAGAVEPPPAAVSLPSVEALAGLVPQHFPGARLIQRLEGAVGDGVLLEHDRTPGRRESWNLGGRAARIMVLVDGKRTVGEIADLLHRRTPPQSPEETLAAFTRFFVQGLLSWREE